MAALTLANSGYTPAHQKTDMPNVSHSKHTKSPPRDYYTFGITISTWSFRRILVAGPDTPP